MKLFETDKEQRVVRLFGKGDARAMDLLYADFAPYLTAVGVRYVPNEADLQDVLQESFIKIFTGMASFEYRGKGSLRAWMSRIVVNEALSLLRKHNSLNFADVPVETVNVPDEPPETDGLSTEKLLALVGRLPAGYRAVFNLYAVEGKSHKEIAEILGIKPDTSASQYHKAKRMLAKFIDEERRKEEYA